MSLTYDFDIFDVIPDQPSDESDGSTFMADIGFEPDARTTKVALFRDPRTALALRYAPEALRNYFIASGFGLNTFDSGAAANRYPLKDEDARLDIIARLTENAGHHTLPRPGDYPEGGDVFRLGEFLAHLAEAQPEMTDDEMTVIVPTHDMVGTSVRKSAKVPMFDTMSVSELAPELDLGADREAAPVIETDTTVAPPRRKGLLHNRFVQVAVALGLAAALVQLTAATGLVVLASL